MFVICRTFFKSLGRFSSHDCTTSGAAMAFYTIFSLPPLLVIVLMITGALGFTKQEVDRIIHDELGFPATQTISEIKTNTPIQSPPSQSESDGPTFRFKAAAARLLPFQIGDLSFVSKIIGILILIFSASGSFGQLQTSLNRVWEVEPDPEKGWIRTFLLKRLLTAGMVIVIGFVLLASLILTTMIDQILTQITGKLPDQTEQIVALVLNEGGAFVVGVLLFAAMFKLLPDAKLRWSDVWLGAATTAFLFVFGKTLIGWYLRTSQVGSSWGASAASSVAALVWVYYSSLIVLFGAELTNAWATRHGEHIAPTEGAVRTVQETRVVR